MGSKEEWKKKWDILSISCASVPLWASDSEPPELTLTFIITCVMLGKTLSHLASLGLRSSSVKWVLTEQKSLREPIHLGKRECEGVHRSRGLELFSSCAGYRLIVP